MNPILNKTKKAIRIPIQINLSSKEKKESFSYLVGHWMGSGAKTTVSLGFAVRNDENYINGLLSKVSLVLNEIPSFRHDKKSYSLYFHSQTKELKKKIEEEIYEQTVIQKYPLEFICGFLDSDGWVSYSDSKKTTITIAVNNTNMDYLLLFGHILDSILLPYNIRLTQDHKKGYKPGWQLTITTSAATYVIANKLLSITLDDNKKEKFTSFIKYFQDLHYKQTIPICETFEGIQGEGKNTGRPQYFIRAATCDMKCVICDSQYSWSKGTKVTLFDLLEGCLKSNYRNVCLTGGEIAQFEDKLSAFIGMLRANDFLITLQTNGLHYSRSFDMIHTVAMDIKTPCTGEKSNEDLILKLNPEKDEIKTLINDMDDYEYAIKINSVTKKIGITQVLQPCNLTGSYFLPVLAKKYKWICELVLRDKRWGNIRVMPQLHLFIWGNERRR